MGESPRVFISYSHDSDAHRRRVLALAERFREDGIDADLDQYVKGTPPEKWPRWMLNRLDWADFVLLVCTPTYYRRFRGHEEPGKGLGVDWEGAVITDAVYADRSAILKFVPILFYPADQGSIPEPVRGHSVYCLDSEVGYQRLYDFLLGQSGTEARPLGPFKTKARGRTEPLRFPADQGEPAAAPPKAEAKRFFVSYRRRAELDRGLATALVEGLARTGHEVFIDVQMPIGTQWVAEIERRIGWCDYLVVLLSEDSIHSEMVQGEVRRAHRRREQEGRPAILPIRVDFAGPLGYELDSWLAPIQQRLWSGPGDSDALIAEILRIAAAGAEASDAPRPPEQPQPGPAPDPRRPLPAKDPRILRVPGGALRADDPFYVRRAADACIDAAAPSPGETLVIKGARQMGKSSLLVRYLQACRTAGKRLAFVDFQGFGGDDLADLPTLLNRLASALLRGLRLPAQEIPKLSSPLDFTSFVEDGILSQTNGPIVFAFDEADRILGRQYQRDFFAMLRMWHNHRAQPFSRWEDVDLVLVIATEPYLLIDAADQSPFNVSAPIDLKGFSRAHLDRLNAGYGGPLDALALDALFDLLGGQPYLTRFALYCIAGTPAMTWPGLADQAASSEGPFGDHLKALLFKLERQPGLLAALRQAIRLGTLPDEATYYRLRGAGLVTRDNGGIRPANALYGRFFGALG